VPFLITVICDPTGNAVVFGGTVTVAAVEFVISIILPWSLNASVYEALCCVMTAGPRIVAPEIVRLVRVPTLVRLDEITLDASVVPEILAAGRLSGTAKLPVHVNRASIAVIAALRVVPQPVSPLDGIGVTPSIRYVVT
jgi:hypothetical protein